MKITILSLALASVFAMNAAQAENIDTTMPGHQHVYNPDGEYGAINNPPGHTYFGDFYFTLEKLVDLSVSAGVNSTNAMPSNDNKFSLYTYDSQAIVVSGTSDRQHHLPNQRPSREVPNLKTVVRSETR